MIVSPGGAIQRAVFGQLVGNGEVDHDRLSLEVVVVVEHTLLPVTVSTRSDVELLSPGLSRDGVVSSVPIGIQHCARVLATT